MGGIGGFILGIGVGNLIAIGVFKSSFVFPWAALIMALIVCTLIGLVSGFYPAQKASKLDPVEALRYE
jgi:putative ABC transport system permease protein